MNLEAYFDGSRNPRFVTLGGFSATPPTWGKFSSRWSAIVREAEAPYLHMREAWGLSGAFDAKLGWDRARRRRLIFALMNMIGEFRNFEDLERTDLFGFSCTVDLEGYNKARGRFPGLKPPESICLDWCAGLQFRRRPEPTARYLSLYFDRNEQFLHKINSVWQTKRTSWRHLVAAIKTIEMKTTPALQLADLLAWVTNRRHTQPDDQEIAPLFFGFRLRLPIFQMTYDYDAIEAKYALRR